MNLRFFCLGTGNNKTHLQFSRLNMSANISHLLLAAKIRYLKKIYGFFSALEAEHAGLNNFNFHDTFQDLFECPSVGSEAEP